MNMRSCLRLLQGLPEFRPGSRPGWCIYGAGFIITPGIRFFWENGSRWISLMNQIPADVTHISLSRGNPENQLEILGSIGNIGISIQEQQ